MTSSSKHHLIAIGARLDKKDFNHMANQSKARSLDWFAKSEHYKYCIVQKKGIKLFCKKMRLTWIAIGKDKVDCILESMVSVILPCSSQSCLGLPTYCTPNFDMAPGAALFLLRTWMSGTLKTLKRILSWVSQFQSQFIVSVFIVTTTMEIRLTTWKEKGRKRLPILKNWERAQYKSFALP